MIFFPGHTLFNCKKYEIIVFRRVDKSDIRDYLILTTSKIIVSRKVIQKRSVL